MAAAKAELSERIGSDWWREGLPVRALARRYGVRRRLVRAAIAAAIGSGATMPNSVPTPGVGIRYMAMQLTRMRRSPSSSARLFDSDITAVFIAA